MAVLLGLLCVKIVGGYIYRYYNDSNQINLNDQ
jgi:hypothetical protein